MIADCSTSINFVIIFTNYSIVSNIKFIISTSLLSILGNSLCFILVERFYFSEVKFIR